MIYFINKTHTHTLTPHTHTITYFSHKRFMLDMYGNTYRIMGWSAAYCRLADLWSKGAGINPLNR